MSLIFLESFRRTAAPASVPRKNQKPVRQKRSSPVSFPPQAALFIFIFTRPLLVVVRVVSRITISSFMSETTTIFLSTFDAE